VWYEALSPDISWVLIFNIIPPPILSYWYEPKVYKVALNIVDQISTIFAHGIHVKGRYLVVVSCLQFISIQLCCNGLTSKRTVMLPPEGIKTLEKLVSQKYKIIFNHDHLLFSAEKLFGEIPKSLGLPFWQVFHPLNATNPNEIAEMMAEVGGKLRLAGMESSSFVQTKVDFTTSFLKSQVGQHHVCNTLDETVLPLLKTWDFKTENEFWLKQTFGRVVQSGLY